MRTALAALTLILPAPALAQATSDREMNTDRPDKTESPYTVPKGRFQIEADVANYTHDRDGGVRIETVGVAPFNAKLGLDDGTDLQFVVAPYIRQTTTDLMTHDRTTIAGFGDVTVRLKHNVWGDDGGSTAFALMPFVTLPTSRSGLGAQKVEFGLIAPLAIKISDTVDLGVMTEVDVESNDNGRGRRVNFVNSATLGFDLTERLHMYSEVFTEHSDAWNVTGDIGLSYAVNDDLAIDTGVNLGLTHAADDVAVFVGLSRRF